MTSYTVWVGAIPDVEYVDFKTATEILEEWLDMGYDDAYIEEHEDSL